MEDSVNHFILVGIYGIISVICISIIMMVLNDMKIQDLFLFQKQNDAGHHFYLTEKEIVKINVLKQEVEYNSQFDPLNYIELYENNHVEKDLLNKVEVYGYVNTSMRGVYPITYVIRHNDIVSKKEVSFKVV